VEGVAFQRDRSEIGVADFDLGGVLVVIESGVDLQAGLDLAVAG
jgi:hypothetical protein